MSLTTQIRVDLIADLVEKLDLLERSQVLNQRRVINLADGVGADQADALFTDQRTLAASGNEELDLSGVLQDHFGATLALARVKALYVHALPANTNNVLVGGAALNGFSTPFSDPTDELVVRPGGHALLIAPDATAFVVTAGTGDLLRFENSGAGTPVTYDVVIIGATA